MITVFDGGSSHTFVKDRYGVVYSRRPFALPTEGVVSVMSRFYRLSDWEHALKCYEGRYPKMVAEFRRLTQAA